MSVNMIIKIQGKNRIVNKIGKPVENKLLEKIKKKCKKK